jgi:glycine/D-amino acid oxidase-like deaminating enzyme/nitrite reductase/ring-hydroxylating ferredoxin subunit
MKNQSTWFDTSPPFDFPQLEERVEVDVLVVGGGITGLTTAFLLKAAGRRVAVVDQSTIGGHETARTTAHVTFVTDARLHQLADDLGETEAHAMWDAGEIAMWQIQNLVAELGIDCGLKQVPGYLFAAVGMDAVKARKSLQRDAALAAKFGFDAEFIESDPLFQQPAVRFPNQLKFHPLKYVNALAMALPGAGSHVFARTSGSDIDAEKRELRANTGTIRYETLVAATNVPIQGERGTLRATLFQTKLASYSTYAIEAEIDGFAESLFWDTNDPYLYLRFDRDGDRSSLIIGGEDHKTGQHENTSGCVDKLEQVLKKTFPSAKPVRNWSGQVIETLDGLPFIGEVDERQFLATGFSGNGMTFGTFSGILIRDLIEGKPNPWSELFSPRRKRLAGAWDYLRENKDYPAYLVKDRLSTSGSVESLHPCSGEIVTIDGKKRAVFSDENGKRTALSPVCPHMGCIVAWNDAEKTWDCPCHGSRFSADGKLIAGPAESDLERV